MSEIPPPPAVPPPARPSRIVTFVRAARTLLWAQLAFGLLAAAVTAWAVFAVRDMVGDRDRLTNRVGELEAQVNSLTANATAAVPLPPPPLPEAPVDAPIAPDTNLATPTDNPPPVIDEPPPTEGPIVTVPPREPPGVDRGPPTRDCSGPNARLPRCRPPEIRRDPALDTLTPRGPALGNPNGEPPQR